MQGLTECHVSHILPISQAYDRLVERRQRILLENAKRTHRIVASLFPKNIRDQILNDDGEFRNGGMLGAKNNLKSFVSGGMNENNIFGQMPIADMYPECTVMVSFSSFIKLIRLNH